MRLPVASYLLPQPPNDHNNNKGSMGLIASKPVITILRRPKKKSSPHKWGLIGGGGVIEDSTWHHDIGQGVHTERKRGMGPRSELVRSASNKPTKHQTKNSNFRACGKPMAWATWALRPLRRSPWVLEYL